MPATPQGDRVRAGQVVQRRASAGVAVPASGHGKCRDKSDNRQTNWLRVGDRCSLLVSKVGHAPDHDAVVCGADNREPATADIGFEHQQLAVG